LTPVTTGLAASLSDLATTFALLPPVLAAAVRAPKLTPALAYLLAHLSAVPGMVPLS
jgi:hypothetical protein